MLSVNLGPAAPGLIRCALCSTKPAQHMRLLWPLFPSRQLLSPRNHAFLGTLTQWSSLLRHLLHSLLLMPHPPLGLLLRPLHTLCRCILMRLAGGGIPGHHDNCHHLHCRNNACNSHCIICTHESCDATCEARASGLGLLAEVTHVPLPCFSADQGMGSTSPHRIGVKHADAMQK